MEVVWSVVSGPGNVTFADASSVATAVSFSEAGEYLLCLTASDGELTGTDEVTISIYPANMPPVVDAGPDRETSASLVELRGYVTDDGLPEGNTLTIQWSIVSGPALVVFGDANAAFTTARFTENGLYTLRLTASDGDLAGEDEVLVQVTGNRAPVADAGPDQTIELFVPPALPPLTNPPPPEQEATWKYDLAQPGLDAGGSRYSVAASSDVVLVAGPFNFANGIEVRRIAEWDGCSYKALYDPRPLDTNNPLSPPVGFIAETANSPHVCIWQTNYYLRGTYLKDLDHDGYYDSTAWWDGEHWWPMSFRYHGSSIVAPRCLVSGPSGVYHGGAFMFRTSNVPEAPYSWGIMKWDGYGWQSLGEGIRDVRDTTNAAYAISDVFAIAEATNGDVYAGGTFTMATSNGLAWHIARWDGTEWRAMGTGLSGRWGRETTTRVYAVACGPDGSVYVGGSFTNAGGVAAYGIARWDGAQWWPLGAGVSSTVHALTFHEGMLYAGGEFNYAGGTRVNRLACWDGTNWWPVGPGTSNGVNGTVAALAYGFDGL
mgnify:CR=1 FL=1